MCGIIYSQSFDGSPVNNAVLQQYDKQRARGTEGFGIYDGEFLNMVHETTEDKILKWLCKYDSNILLLHHRYPTSTKNVRKAAHPFSTRAHFGNHEYILVHNGVISNAANLFIRHQELGIEYQSLLDDLTFNDSESLLWDFALFMEGKQTEMESYGDMAFICMRKTDGVLTELYFARNGGRPLRMNWTADKLELSSEGEGDNIPADTLYVWDYKDQTFDTKFLSLPEYYWNYQPSSQSSHQTNTCGYPSSYSSYYDNDEDEPEDDYSYNQQTIYDTYDGEETGLVGTLVRRYYELTAGRKKGTQSPSQQAIEKTALDYLAMFRGHFEQAYWAAESDYEDTQEDLRAVRNGETVALMTYLRLLEGVMEYLEHDPENVDANSVSSLWGEIYNTNNKVGFTA